MSTTRFTARDQVRTMETPPPAGARPCVCITPTYDRHAFLEAAYATFDAQTYPRKAWVVVDSSRDPAPMFTRLDDDRVVYVHIPDRTRLAETVPAEYLETCRAHILESPDELARRVLHLQQHECERIRMPDRLRPSIGEARNLAAALGRDLFGGDEQVIISHKDDDDYYHPTYLDTIERAMRDADWVKLKSFLVHVIDRGGQGRYGRYDYDRSHGPALLIEDGRERPIDHYVVCADANNRVVADWDQAAFFGLLFNYSYAALEAAGGFFPLNRAEDIHFYRGLIRPRDGAAPLRLRMLDESPELVCRIAHSRTQRTLVHEMLSDEDVPAKVRAAVSRFVHAAPRRRVLLTNDGGVLSDGLRALHAALSERFDVHVVAPMDERSGVGHGVSLHAALAHRTLPKALGLEGVGLSGTPVACVKSAMSGVFGPRPDVVVAGMNDGENTGVTIYNSGTSSAAREAAIHGLPSFAVSLVRGAPDSLDEYARLAARIIADLLERPAAPGVYYNLNLPARPVSGLDEVRVTRLGMGGFTDVWDRDASAGGQATVRLRGGSRPADHSLDFDTAAVAAGYVSLTPLTVDATHAALRTHLAEALRRPLRSAG